MATNIYSLALTGKHVNSPRNLRFKKIRDSLFSTNEIQALKKNNPGPLGATGLSVANLNSLTSIVDGKDIAQVNSEQYINNNIVYYMNEDLRKTVLGKQSKPVLNAKLLQIATLPGAEKFYTDISVPWLAYGIAQTNADFKVNQSILSGDLTVFFQKSEFLDQSNLLYQYAFIEQVPQIKDYIDDTAGNWAQQYLTYLSGGFLAAYPSVVKASGQQVVNVMLRPLLAKLDLLDTTGEASTTLQYKLNMALLQDQIYTQIGTVSGSDNFQKSIVDAINEILESGDNSRQVSEIRQMSTLAGGSVNLASQLAKAFTTVITTDILGPAANIPDLGAAIAQRGANDFSTNVRNYLTNPTTAKFVQEALGALFLVVSTISLGFAYANWNILNTVTKTRAVFNSVQLLASIMALPASSAFFTTLAEIAGAWFLNFLRAKGVGEVGVANTTWVLKAIFRDKFDGFISSRIMPLFILANIGFMIYDIVQDVDSKNWGALSLDIIAVVLTTMQLVAAVASVVPWSGPVGTVLSVLTAVVILIKILVFPSKSPIQKFHDSLPLRYTANNIPIGSPQGLTSRSNIKDASTDNNFMNPNKDSESKLRCDNDSPYLNANKLSFIYNSGYLTIQNPLNTLSGTQGSSFLSCRVTNPNVDNSGDLTLFPASSGPAVETEAWVMIATGKENTFYLMSWNSKFLTVKDNGDLKLSDSMKSKFWFSQEIDWFLPSSGCSLLFNYSIGMNKVVSNDKYAIALVPTGAFLVDISSDVKKANEDIGKFMKDNPSKVQTKICEVEDGVTLSDKAYLKINSDGDPIIKDKSNKYQPKLQKSSKNVKFESPYAIVIPDTNNTGFKVMVVDNYYQTVRSNNF